MFQYNGVINYAILFLILILLLFVRRVFKKYFKFNYDKKDNLSGLISSFFSLVIFIYFILKVDSLFSLYTEYHKLGLSPILNVFVYIAFVFIFFILYKIVKRIILRTIKLIGLDTYFNKQNHVNQWVVALVTFSKMALFLVYLATLLTLFSSNLYEKGYTKPFVNTHLVKSQYSHLYSDLDQVNRAYSEIDAFTNLFKKDDLFKNIDDFQGIIDQIENQEEFFMEDIYPDLPKETQEEIADLYFDKYKLDVEDEIYGVYVVLLEDAYYKEVLNEPKGLKKIIIKIPVIGKIIYGNDPLYNQYLYINQNEALINYTDEHKHLYENKEVNIELIIVSFKDEFKHLQTIKDAKNKDVIVSLNNRIETYYEMRNWMIDVIKKENPSYFKEKIDEYQIIDGEVMNYMKDRDQLDQVIKQFNVDYKTNKLKNKVYKNAFNMTKSYLKEYRNESIAIEKEIDPKVRLGAAYIRTEVDLEDYLMNEETFIMLLKELNKECQLSIKNINGKNVKVCENDEIYRYVNMFMWGYLYDHKQKELSVEKLETLFEEINSFNNKYEITTELKVINNQLIFDNEDSSGSYLKESYENNLISYQIMKLLYLYDEFTTNEFNSEIKDLLK